MRWDAFVDRVANWLCRTFPSRYRVVPHATTGEPMLRQFRVTKRIYLQQFLEPEEHEYMHNHRWEKVRSIVLSGMYVEERPGRITITRRAGQTHTMDRSVIHRIAYWSPLCWTLFFQSKRQNLDEWFYFTANPLRWAGKHHWIDHIQRRVPNLEGDMTK